LISSFVMSLFLIFPFLLCSNLVAFFMIKVPLVLYEGCGELDRVS
jgi:hypothetical protein